MKYTILKNNHRSGYYFKFIKEDKFKISGTFIFKMSCLYELTENEGQINKLFGYSVGHHHTNSIRIGWYCKNGELYICGYYYKNGKRMDTFHKIIKPCTTYNFTFIRSKVKDILLIDYTIAMSTNLGKHWFKYLLFPYFGGKVPAPHEMKIDLDYSVKKLVD